jgi:hypothetical protein
MNQKATPAGSVTKYTTKKAKCQNPATHDDQQETWYFTSSHRVGSRRVKLPTATFFHYHQSRPFCILHTPGFISEHDRHDDHITDRIAVNGDVHRDADSRFKSHSTFPSSES